LVYQWYKQKRRAASGCSPTIYMIQAKPVYCGDYVFLEKSPCVADRKENAKCPQELECLSKNYITTEYFSSIVVTTYF
jgi:hypothetical protein